MCAKLPFRDLNFGPYSAHHTSTYICAVTIVPKEFSGGNQVLSPNSYVHVRKVFVSKKKKKKKLFEKIHNYCHNSNMCYYKWLKKESNEYM